MERGGIPEVAALGNALTALFNTLELSQNAYAVRISMDKSAVSRYLRGRRIAPQDFVDRLLREVETRRRTPVTDQVRSRLVELRLSALKVVDPDAHELESLRAERERSQRKVEVLARHQEALHDLLDKKEAQVRSLRGELEQLRQDWVADRMQGGAEEGGRERLEQQIAELKAELDRLADLRGNAERRCEELEARVLDLEEELAQRDGEGVGVRLPVAVLTEQLELEAADYRSVGRELTEAALERPVDELKQLVRWLSGRDLLHLRRRLLEQVVRTRGIDEVTAFAAGLQPQEGLDHLVAEVCDSLVPQDIAYFYSTSDGAPAENIIRHLIISADPVHTALILSQLDPPDSRLEAHFRECVRNGLPSSMLKIVGELWAFKLRRTSALLCSVIAKQIAWGMQPIPTLAVSDTVRHGHLVDALLATLPPESVVLVLSGAYYDPSGRAPYDSALKRLAQAGKLAEITALAGNRARPIGSSEPLQLNVRRWVGAFHEAAKTWASANLS